MYIGNTGSSGTFTGNFLPAATPLAVTGIYKVGSGSQLIQPANPSTAPVTWTTLGMLGGTLEVNQPTLTTVTNLNIASGTLQMDQSLTTGNAQINFGWALDTTASHGNLTVTNGGSLTLGNNIVYNGYNNPNTSTLTVSSPGVRTGCGPDVPGRPQPDGQLAGQRLPGRGRGR